MQILLQKKQFIGIKTEFDGNPKSVWPIESRMVSYSDILIILSQLWNSIYGYKSFMGVKSFIKSRKMLYNWCSSGESINQSEFKVLLDVNAKTVICHLPTNKLGWNWPYMDLDNILPLPKADIGSGFFDKCI